MDREFEFIPVTCEYCSEPISMYEINEHELLCEKRTKNNWNTPTDNYNDANKYPPHTTTGGNDSDSDDSNYENDDRNNNNNDDSDDDEFFDWGDPEVQPKNKKSNVYSSINNYTNENNIYKRNHNSGNDECKLNDVLNQNIEDPFENVNEYSDNKFSNDKFSDNKNVNNDDRPLTIVAIGKTGCGKSTLLNRFCNDTSEKGDKGPFKAKGGNKSVTQSIQCSTQNFNFKHKELRQYNNILCSMIDTPGLADSGGNEEKLVNEVRRFFQKVCTGVHVFIITFSVTNIRFDTNIQNLLHLLTELFGKEFWRHVMIVFTRHDVFYNHKVHKDEFNDCMAQYPRRIKELFNLNFEICSTGIGKNNYIKAIQDILKFSKNRGIFECQYMKSWREAGGIGNPKQRLERENQLILAMTNQEEKHKKELLEIKKQLQEQIDKQKKEKEEWQKNLMYLQDSNQQIKQLEMRQKKQNKELEEKIKNLQRRNSNDNNNNNKDRGFFGTVFAPLLGGIGAALGRRIYPNNDNSNDDACLIM